MKMRNATRPQRGDIIILMTNTQKRANVTHQQIHNAIKRMTHNITRLYLPIIIARLLARRRVSNIRLLRHLIMNRSVPPQPMLHINLHPLPHTNIIDLRARDMIQLMMMMFVRIMIYQRLHLRNRALV